MEHNQKFMKAISNIRPDTEYIFNDEITTEEHFNAIRWKTGVDGNTSISTTVNPHPELTWPAVSAEMDRVQAEYDALDYARKREAEYPKIGDQLDKIYHEGIDAWKADMITPIKNKYPKG